MAKRSYKKIILVILSSVFILLVVFAVGMYVGFKKAKETFPFIGGLFAAGMSGQYAYMQYMNADYDEAKKALLGFINLLDEMKSQGLPPDKFGGKGMYFFDTGLTYARLALLEEKFGNSEEKERYMSEAKNRFEAAGWGDFSEDKIREVLEKLDKQLEL